MAEPSIFATLLGALAGLLAVSAVRDLLREAPGVMRWTVVALAPIMRAGREGYLPSRPENRRLVFAVVILAIAGGWLFLGPAAVVPLALAAPVVARGLIGHRRRRYRRELEAAIPDAAIIIADSLGAGRSLRTALCDLATALDGAAAGEFSALRVELEMGAPTAAAINGLRRRLQSPRVDSFCAAILTGRRSGTDLAALMRRFGLAAAAQDRDARDAHAATAQARFTGLLVVAMPLGGTLFAELVQPGFLISILRSPVAAMLVAAACLMQLLGFLAIRRLARAGA